MEINRDNVLEICRKSNIHPSKDYGQNFLIAEDASKRIVDLLEINYDDYVLEVGPGIGSLTHFLSQYSNRIDVVDIDINMINFLKVVYQNTNINVIFDDVRKHNVSEYTKIITNLPYNITTEVIVYLLLNAKEAKKLVLMCQNETFLHFFNTSGSEYGPTSILIHLLGDIKKDINVGKGCFYPVPKVDSVVFEINIAKEINQEIIDAYKLAKSLFLNRRKTIYNNLSFFVKDKGLTKDLLSKVSIDPQLRPEQIKPEKYLELSNLIKETKQG